MTLNKGGRFRKRVSDGFGLMEFGHSWITEGRLQGREKRRAGTEGTLSGSGEVGSSMDSASLGQRVILMSPTGLNKISIVVSE